MDILEIVGREWVLKKAAQVLCAKSRFITDQIAPLSEGGPHDFYSNADYWWPNPDTPGGMPYPVPRRREQPGQFQSP